MHKHHFYLSLFLILFSIKITVAEEISFSSGTQKNILLELYTSEGCSSCPPADKWISKLLTDDKLWVDIIPVSFHVDYWDYLGWQDRFAKPAYSQRQRDYAKLGYTRSVYTPGFFENGREWRGFFQGRRFPDKSTVQVGEINTLIIGNKIQVRFTPKTLTPENLKLHLVLLGSDLSTSVNRGENHGKTLKHNFIVLEKREINLQLNNNQYHWQGELNNKLTSPKPAIALWITTTDNPTPIQSTGSWLTKPTNHSTVFTSPTADKPG